MSILRNPMLPEVYVEGVEEVDDIHAEDAINGSVLQERKAGGVFAPYVQRTAVNGFSEF